MLETSDAYFPIPFMRIDGDLSLDDVESVIEFVRAMQARARAEGTRMVLVVDVLKTNAPDAAARSRLGEFTRGQTEADEALLLGALLMIESALMRGALTALSWLAPGKLHSTHAVKGYREAVARARKLFEDAGQPVPDALDAFARERADAA